MVNYDLFNDNLATLEKLLKEQMQVMKKELLVDTTSMI